MPLDVNQRLDLQQPFDVLLQKPTDYLKNTEDDGNVPPFTADLLQLNTYVNERLVNVTVVDPLSHVQNVMDRALLGNMLAGVCHQACQAGVQLRCPKWHLLTDPLSMTQQCLEGVSMAPPIILKPKVSFPWVERQVQGQAVMAQLFCCPSHKLAACCPLPSFCCNIRQQNSNVMQFS